MSQAKTSALDLAIAQAAEHHLAAEKTLAGARTRLRSAQSTWTTLDTYRGEYAKRLRAISTSNKDTLGNYHRFLDKLTVALDTQQQDVNQAEQTVNEQQTRWFHTLRRLKSMELLRSRRAAAAQAKIMRQEQKQSDEFAARIAYRSQGHHRYEPSA